MVEFKQNSVEYRNIPTLYKFDNKGRLVKPKALRRVGYKSNSEKPGNDRIELKE